MDNSISCFFLSYLAQQALQITQYKFLFSAIFVDNFKEKLYKT